MKHFLSVFLLAFALTTSAQKYDYGILHASEPFRKITWSNGQKTDKIEIDKNELKEVGFRIVSLAKLKDLENQGWELFETEAEMTAAGLLEVAYFLKQEREE